MFSKKCECAIRALIYVALESTKEGKSVTQVDIARQIEESLQLTAEILQQLNDARILHVNAQGNYFLTPEECEKLKLIQVVDAIDGDKVFNGCGLGLSECNASKPCPMHEYFLEIRDDIKWMLTRTTMETLTKDLSLGETFLKR